MTLPRLDPLTLHSDLSAYETIRDYMRYKFNYRDRQKGGYRGDYALSPSLCTKFNFEDLSPAAVMLLVVVSANEEPSILLTRRPAHMNHHPNEWCFPGGKKDENDTTEIATALRETEEEIGLLKDDIELISVLSPYHVRSGFNIRTVIGLVKEPLNLELSSDEVAEVRKIPLSALLNPGNKITYDDSYGGASFQAVGYDIKYDGKRILFGGASASILSRFCDILQADIVHKIERNLEA